MPWKQISETGSFSNESKLDSKFGFSLAGDSKIGKDESFMGPYSPAKESDINDLESQLTERKLQVNSFGIQLG